MRGQDDPGAWPGDGLALPPINAGDRWPLGRQNIIPLLGGLVRLGTQRTPNTGEIVPLSGDGVQIAFRHGPEPSSAGARASCCIGSGRGKARRGRTEGNRRRAEDRGNLERAAIRRTRACGSTQLSALPSRLGCRGSRCPARPVGSVAPSTCAPSTDIQAALSQGSFHPYPVGGARPMRPLPGSKC